MLSKTLQTKRHYILGKTIVGIDPSKKKHQAVVIDSNGFQLGKPFIFSTTFNGYTHYLWYNLQKILSDVKPDRLVFAIETSCNLWQTLSFYLDQKGYKVLLVSPLTTKHSRPLMDKNFSRTDPKDALLIANNAHSGHFDFLQMYTDSIIAMHQLGIAYHKLRKDYCCAVQRLRSLVERIFPEFMHTLQVDSATGRYLLTKYFLPQDYKDLDLDKEVDAVSNISSKKLGFDTVVELKQSASQSIGVPTFNENAQAERLIIKTWLKMIEVTEKQMDAILNQLKVLAKQTPEYDILSSLKGLGISDTMISLFIAEVRTPRNFTHYKKLEKLAGYTLRRNDSGKFIGQRKINRIGSKRLSWILYWMTRGAIKYIPEVRSKYLRRQMRHSNYRKNVVACIPVLLQLIVAMIRENRPYKIIEERVKHVESLEKKVVAQKGKKTKKHGRAA